MTESSDVTQGTDVLETEYNNLRKDVLSLTLGHMHNGTDSKTLATDSVDTDQIKALAVDTAELAASAVETAKIADSNVTYTKLGYAAGDILLSSANTERTKSNDVTYTLVKEIEIDKGGTLRIKFEKKGTRISAPFDAAEIFVNGSSTGHIAGQTAPNDYELFSFDVSGLQANDLVQLYYQTGSAGSTVYVKEFRLYKAALDGVTVNTD